MPSPPKRPRKKLRNIEIALRLEAIADMLALQSANPFRVRAYQNAARTLRRHGVEMVDMIARGEDLCELEGVGEDLAGKIADLARTGTTEIYETLKRQTPPLAFELIEVPGLGPKRTHALLKELRPKPRTLGDIAQAARQERVRKVSGFGPKAEADLLKSLDSATRPTRRLIAAAKNEAEALVAYVRSAPGVREAIVAGSYRRGRESIGDLDIVVSAEAGKAVIEHLKSYPGVVDILAAGATRATIVLRTGLQVDMRVVRPPSFGAALLYFTGAKAHVVALRALARERKRKLNEYGLYREGRKLAGVTEEEIYRALGLDFIAPELREARGEIDAARAHELPRLVELAEVRGDLCVRCSRAEVSDVIASSKARGWSYLAIVSRLNGAAGETPGERRAAIKQAQPAAGNLRLFNAIEVDIGADGLLLARESEMKSVDFVIAAVNSDFDLPRQKQTARLLAALSHQRVAILNHPTGRIINKREPIDADWPRILHTAAEFRVSLGLSGDPERLDLTDIHCRMARQAGVSIAIGSDAHTGADLDRMGLAVTQARRGWLEAGDVLNTGDADAVFARLQRAPARALKRREEASADSAVAAMPEAPQ